MLQFLRYTGCRRSEALAITWADLDLDAEDPVVHIAKVALPKAGGGITVRKSGKSRNARRIVSLPPALVKVLSAWRVEQERQRDFVGDAWEGEDFVFTGMPLGAAPHPDSVSTAFKRAARKAGVPEVSLKGLRDAAATRLFEVGTVQPLTVTQRLGHANVAFTQQRYGHVSPGMRQEAAAILESAYREV